MFKLMNIRSTPIMALIVCALFTACASIGGKSFSPSDSANAATIKGYWNREGPFTWEGYGVLAVDDKFIQYSLFEDPPLSTTRIEPGPRRIVATARFSPGYGTGPGRFVAFVPMEIDLKPSSQYQLKGKVSGATVEVWLETVSNNERASRTFSAPYRRSEPTSTTIPIIIPAR